MCSSPCECCCCIMICLKRPIPRRRSKRRPVKRIKKEVSFDKVYTKNIILINKKSNL